MARRRFQRGSLRKRIGVRSQVWVGQWREDELVEGRVVRRFHKEVLGTLADYPTRKLAQRELDRRLSDINSVNYRARPTITFKEFADKWQQTVLPNLKPSTQLSIRSHLHRHLLPACGSLLLKDVSTEILQKLISSWTGCGSAKSIKNIVTTLRIMWNAGKSWGYVSHNPFQGLSFSKRIKPATFAFTLDEVRKILAVALEPYKTFYWLAAETGLRAGELCGLRIEDVNLREGSVQVRQSVWRGAIGNPKSAAGVRAFTISRSLCEQLRLVVDKGRPCPMHLLFHSGTGSPWDANMVVKRKLRPLLDRLGIRRAGLHAFRHTNASLMNSLNTDIKTRQARLRHSDSSMTLDVYTHAEPEADRRVAEQLGEMLAGAKPPAVYIWQQEAGNA